MQIAFISDIHFGKNSCTSDFAVPGETQLDETSNSPSLLDGLAEIIRSNSASYLFIAGDLTSSGTPQELYYCKLALLKLAKMCNIDKNNILLALGNHDINWDIINLSEAYKPISDEVEEIISDGYQKIAAYAPKALLNQIINIEKEGPAPFSGIVESDYFITFILNSSCFCTGKQHNSHGRLDNTQLEWFDSNLSVYDSDKRIKIVLLHHHPFNYPYPVLGEDASLLEEGSEFIEIAAKHGINLVLHGHRHHPRVKTTIENGWKSPITFVCAGSVSVNCQGRNWGRIPNTAHIIDLTNGPQSFLIKTYQYSPSKGWVELKEYSEETPLDPCMKVGKVVDHVCIHDRIKELIDSDNSTIILHYDSLPDELYYCYYHDLNRIISELLSDDYNICGEFPDDVAIIKKESSLG